MVLRVAVVGVGRWGRNHVRVLKELEKEGLVQLVALCDTDLSRARSVANEFSVPYVVQDLSELYSLRIDAAVVATPIDTLTPVSLKLIEKGINVLVEKPVATCVAEIRKLIEAERKHNVVVMPGFIMRFNPVVRKAKEIVKSMESEILYAVFRRLSRRPQHARKYSILLDLAVHDIDLCRYIMSTSNLELVSSSRTFLVEDEVVVAFLRSDNRYCLIHVDGLSLSKVREIELIGRNTFVRCNTDDLTITIRRFDGSYTIERLVGEEPLKLEDRSFIQAVSGYRVDIPTLEDALAVMEVIESIARRSS